MKILLVEDREDDVLLLKHELKRLEEEPEVSHVESLAGLREALSAQQFDIVISDYNLPGLEIHDVIKHVHDHDSALPVIVISGNIGEEVAVEVMRAGAKDFLRKDSLGRLLPVIRREIEDSQTRRAQYDGEYFMTRAAAITKSIALGEDVNDSLAEICKLIDSLCPGTTSCVLIMSEDGKRLNNGASPGMPDAYADMVEGFEIGPKSACCGTAAFLKKEIVSAAILKDERWEGFEAVAEVTKMRACWSSPLMNNEGKVLGTYGQYLATEREPTDNERRVVFRALELATLALQRYRDESSLRDREEMLRAMADSTRYSIMMVDPECTQTLFINRPFREVLGEGKATNATSLDTILAYIRESLEDEAPFDRFFEAFKTGALDGEVGEVFLKGGGQVRWGVSTVHHADKSVLGRLLVLEDISDLRDLEDRLRQASKLEALGTLAGGIAHDFNNILTPIMGLATLGVNDARQEDTQRKRWGTVLNSSRRARDLIRKILSFSRRADVRVESIDIGSMIRSSIELLQEALPSTIEIQTSLGEHEFFVNGDPATLEQVFLNVATNAFHAMEEEGGLLKIQVAQALTSDLPSHAQTRNRMRKYVRIDVIDSGAGIPLETVGRIFDPFYTTKPVGKGTGLGLSQAIGIVQAHEGAIDVATGPEGTTFSIFLPVSSQELTPLTPIESVNEFLEGDGRILVIDDEVAIREMQQECLENFGYQVLVAEHGEAALEILSSDVKGFDLILTDQTMPKLKGTDFVRRLRESGDQTPVILCTGVLTSAISLEAEALGIARTISKPIALDKLSIMVADVIEDETAKSP